ncbi:hypothetical protein WISP_56489 [Willisornis vidua]|uniref:Uncharacterized protein n=1 Tax=Willisornis vidua TaxID=1566151 RepID=A0ABQ9DIA1_9PASS|nr:hypothetical protein WISP_56489 [Willisornis vidua]
MKDSEKEKAEVLDDFCASVFNSKCSSHGAQVEKGKCRDWQKEDLKSSGAEDQVGDHLKNLNVHKGPDEHHPHVLRELEEEVVSSRSGSSSVNVLDGESNELPSLPVLQLCCGSSSPWDSSRRLETSQRLSSSEQVPSFATGRNAHVHCPLRASS